MYRPNDQQTQFYSSMASRNYKKIAFATLAAILAFIIGVLIGYFSWKNEIKYHKADGCHGSDPPSRINKKTDDTITGQILQAIDVEKLDQVLRHLTEKPRLAGTRNQRLSADYIHRKNLEFGLSSEIVEYNVLLSYPKDGYNNTVHIVDKDGKDLFRSNPYEENLGFKMRDPDEGPAFNAYCPGGKVEGDLIDVGYGAEETYRHAEYHNVSITGKVVIARYGRMFRGNIVQNAERAGAAGIIIFSSPNDYGPPENMTSYPDTWYLPDSGIQRGNVVLLKGDQATPGYPSTEYAYRLTGEDLKRRMPRIPCQPISARDAEAILGHLDFNNSFSGMLKENRKVVLNVHNEVRERPIFNVIGKITGEIEPDRYIVIGNHRDAWLYGSFDPASGATVLLEISRIFGDLVKKGWRPRRSILFCSWDAEEYGLVGSYEWVEDNMKWLKSKVVAYINSDSPISGNKTLSHRGIPILNKLFIEATKKISDPEKLEESLYESWMTNTGGKISPVGGGSDHMPFVANAGIPSMYSKFRGSLDTPWFGSSTPLYHSRYETYHAYKMIDPEMKYSRAMTGLIAEITRSLADSVILPFDLDSYLEDLQDSVVSMYDFLRYTHNITTDAKYIDGINEGLNILAENVAELKKSIENVDQTDSLSVRAINDKLMSLEEALLDDHGLPDRPHFKNILHSPSSINYYGPALAFPGIQSLANQLALAASQEIKEQVLDRIHQHLSVISYSIHSAAKVLQM